MEKTEQVKAGKYCPVCEKVYREGLDFCPVHPTVLIVRIMDWGEGFKIFETGSYDEEHDDFGLNEGLDRDIIDGAGGLTMTQLKRLMGKGQNPHPNPLIAEWRRRHTPND